KQTRHLGGGIETDLVAALIGGAAGDLLGRAARDTRRRRHAGQALYARDLYSAQQAQKSVERTVERGRTRFTDDMKAFGREPSHGRGRARLGRSYQGRKLARR